MKISAASEGTVYMATYAYHNPMSEHVVCPIDGEMGTSYVNTLSEKDDVGYASAFLSYSWSYRWHDVVPALTEWVDQSQTRVPERTYIWICALCLSNHRSIDLLTAEDLARTFKTRVQAIGIVLPLLAPWDNPVYVTRAWCLCELYQTLKLGLKKCTVNILLPPSQLALLQLRGCQYTRIRGDRPGSRSDPGGERHREPAVRPPGHREIISNIPGGFPLLNVRVTVQKSLWKWFTRHGAVDTASRWALFPTMMNLNIDGTTLPPSAATAAASAAVAAVASTPTAAAAALATVAAASIQRLD